MEIVLKELQAQVLLLEQKMTKLEKTVRKIKKDMIPESERKVREPSGFAKPTYLSPSLCEFLGIPANEELPRTEVTKRVLNYVKEQDLQNKTERRLINMDDKLQKLLQPPPGQQVSYFTIQKLLKVHYVKPDTVAEPVAEPVVEPVVEPVNKAPVVLKKTATRTPKKSVKAK